jgi:hypothetical protein
MTPIVQVDKTAFDRAMLLLAKHSKRGVADAINSRLFFILVRMLVLLPPRSMKERRQMIRAYLNAPVGNARQKNGRTVAKGRQLQRVHLIAQAMNRNKPFELKGLPSGSRGLYGERMKAAAAIVRRRAIGSVGYIKSGVLKAIRRISPGFTAAGATRRGKSADGKRVDRVVKANGAYVELARQYGVEIENVGSHRGNNARATKAQDGVNPTASARVVAGVADGQEATVDGIYSQTGSRVMADETAEMDRMLRATFGDIYEQALKPNGFEMK